MIALFVLAGATGGIATLAPGWSRRRAAAALVVGGALQAMLVQFGPPWELLMGSPDQPPRFTIGVLRAGALLLPLVLVRWGGFYGRASSGLAWLGVVLLVGHLSTPFDTVPVSFEGGPTNSVSIYATLPVAVLVILIGVPFGRLYGRSRFFGGSVRAAAA